MPRATSIRLRFFIIATELAVWRIRNQSYFVSVSAVAEFALALRNRLAAENARRPRQQRIRPSPLFRDVFTRKSNILTYRKLFSRAHTSWDECVRLLFERTPKAYPASVLSHSSRNSQNLLRFARVPFSNSFEWVFFFF